VPVLAGLAGLEVERALLRAVSARLVHLLILVPITADRTNDLELKKQACRVRPVHRARPRYSRRIVCHRFAVLTYVVRYVALQQKGVGMKDGM
jgi:hypothetical protein